MEKRKTDRRIVIAVWVGILFLIWELAALLIRTVIPVPSPETKIPYFHDVVITFVTGFVELAESAWVTFVNAAHGFLIGTLIGCVVALVMSWSKAIEKIGFPYLIVSQMIPVLGLAPIIYKLVGGGDQSKIAISAFISFFPVAVNLLDGFHSVDVLRKELLYSYSTAKPITYLKLMIPSSLPALFTGMKIAAPRTITAAILIEMMGSEEGIGVKILYALYYSGAGSTKFWSCIIMAAILGMLSSVVVSLLERLVIPWERAMIRKGEA